MSWLTVNSTTKISKTHLDEIISRLNTQRSQRGYSTISIPITTNTTRILGSHIMNIRSTIDRTPLTVGCSAHNRLVYSAQNGTYRSSNDSAVLSSRNSSANSGQNSSRNATNQTVCSHNTVVHKAPCFIFMEK